MLKSDERYKSEVIRNIYDVYNQDLLPANHYRFLEFSHDSFRFEPFVIFDIGSAVLHWERHAKRIRPGSEIICFDAFSQ